MDLKSLRQIAFAGILIALCLSVWYFIRTYKADNPQWMYLILSFGITILLLQNLRKGKVKRKD